MDLSALRSPPNAGLMLQSFLIVFLIFEFLKIFSCFTHSLDSKLEQTLLRGLCMI